MITRILALALLLTGYVSAPAATIPIQASTIIAPTLPAGVTITGQVSGLTFDIYMANGACTQTVRSSPTLARLTFQWPAQQTFTQGITAYGKYCFFLDAWDAKGNKLPAMVYTTVEVVQK